MSNATFVIRTVRKGTITISGMRFSPEQHHQPYDGRLDGLRFAFGRYRDYETGGWKPLAALWGNEEAYQRSCRGDDDLEHGPELVDGGFPWYFWHGEKR